MQNVMQNAAGFNYNQPVYVKFKGLVFTVEHLRYITDRLAVAPIYGEQYPPAFVNSLATLIANGDRIEYTEHVDGYGYVVYGTFWSEKLQKTFQITGRRGENCKYPSFQLV